MVPFIGTAATGGKILSKTVKYSDEVVDAGKNIKGKKGGSGKKVVIDENINRVEKYVEQTGAKT